MKALLLTFAFLLLSTGTAVASLPLFGLGSGAGKSATTEETYHLLTLDGSYLVASSGDYIDVVHAISDYVKVDSAYLHVNGSRINAH